MPTVQDSDLLLVNRGGKDYRITAHDFKNLEGDEATYLLVNRNKVDHKVSKSELDLYLTPVPTFTTVVVGTEYANWSPYIKVEDYDNGAPKDIYLEDNEKMIWYYTQSERNPDRIFNGVDSEPGLYACTMIGTTFNPNVIFAPPGGINVQESLTIVAGFHGSARLGTLAVNGVDTLEFEAHDLDPQPFTVPFKGDLDSFSIRQKNPRGGGGGPPFAPGISAVYLDGKQLLNINATVLTFEDGEFFDQLRVGTQLQQVNPLVTGVVSKVEADKNRVVLDDIYPEFVTGGTVIIVGAEALEKSQKAARGIPFDDDLFLVNRGGINHKTTAKELKDYAS